MSRPRPHRALGAWGESVVAEWYRQRGYEVLSANWRCSQGEIDLVLSAPAEREIVFCEVKTRSSSAFGTPFEAVTELKQRRLRLLATRWLSQRRSEGLPLRGLPELRFDVAAVYHRGEGMEVEVLQGAF